MRDEAVQWLVSCQNALAEEDNESKDSRRRNETLHKQLEDVKNELGKEVDLVAEKVTKQIAEYQSEMELNIIQKEVTLKGLQQKQSQVPSF